MYTPYAGATGMLLHINGEFTMEKLRRSKFSNKIWRQKLKRKHRPRPHKKLNGRSDLRVTLSIFYSM